MNSVIEFFKGIFDTRIWPARWHCGYWTDSFGWLYITSVQEDLEIKILEKNTILHMGEIPLVIGNLSYLNQLFLNLISNVIKFTNQQPVISITGETIGSGRFNHVSDNGIGIDPLIRGHVN